MLTSSCPAAGARPGRAVPVIAAVLGLLACKHELTRDPRVLYGMIRAEYAEQDKLLCPCEVDDGKYESIAECEARHALTDTELECYYGVLEASQDVVVESLQCTLGAEEALSACVQDVGCTTKDRLDCAIAYMLAIEPCTLPSVVAAKIEAECFGASTQTCEDGQIITDEMRCNGVPDCGDATDERLCPGRFTCKDGFSIPENWACDGDSDCADESDETLCAAFTCSDGATIPPTWVCDGEPDCDDGEDEDGCG